MADKKLHTADSESTTDKVIEKSDSAEMPPFKKEEKFFVPLNFFGLLILKNERMKSIEEKNNVKLIILPAENSSTEKVGLQILQINGDPKDVEKAVLVIQNILEEDDGKNRLKRILPKQRSKDGSEFECPICCETFNISDDECVKCTPTDIFEQSTATSATTNESHSICISCIQEYARSAITGRVAVGGLGLNCVSDGCKNHHLKNI
uniref:K Homology domain-containing protein n=1 Tax=Panagrolaimus superbus TaxID=310955 RepID=A0A914Z8L0_9BILA